MEGEQSCPHGVECEQSCPQSIDGEQSCPHGGVTLTIRPHELAGFESGGREQCARRASRLENGLKKVHKLSAFSVEVDREELLRLLGYRRSRVETRRTGDADAEDSSTPGAYTGIVRTPDRQLQELMAEMTQEAGRLAEPKAVYSLFGQDDLPPGSFLSSLVRDSFAAGKPADAIGTNAGPALPVSSAAVAVALAVCTIGQALEERVAEYSSSGELTRGLILDAAGSVLAEASCDFVNQAICGVAAERSLHATCRTSPGYGKWEVKEQAVVFKLLPAHSIGVTLTSSFMMVPRKSVSFAVRLLSEKPADERLSPCTRCGRKECEFRR